MIQYIQDIKPHIIELEENHDDMKAFLEAITDIFIRYEVGKFQTPDGKLYKAELITKTETTRTTRKTHQTANKIYSWTVEQCREVTLEYHFKEVV